VFMSQPRMVLISSRRPSIMVFIAFKIGCLLTVSFEDWAKDSVED